MLFLDKVISWKYWQKNWGKGKGKDRMQFFLPLKAHLWQTRVPVAPHLFARGCNDRSPGVELIVMTFVHAGWCIYFTTEYCRYEFFVLKIVKAVHSWLPVVPSFVDPWSPCWFTACLRHYMLWNWKLSHISGILHYLVLMWISMGPFMDPRLVTAAHVSLENTNWKDFPNYDIIFFWNLVISFLHHHHHHHFHETHKGRTLV